MKNSYLSILWAALVLVTLFPITLYAETYTYDETGRLSAVSYADGSAIAYSYDANGNILGKSITPAADRTAPVITLQGDNPVTLAVGVTYNDAGATATDDVDGDISSNIVTTNPVNTGAIGSYTVSYNVSDAAGNAAAEVTRTVNIVNAGDQSAPVITLLGATPVTITQGTAYNDAGATATDDVDGDISSRIVIANPVNTNVAGSYTITYDVKDSAGNAASQVVRVVNVTSPSAPASEKKKGIFGSVGLVSLLLLLFPLMFRFFARPNE